MRVADFRSDTVTRPSPAMRKAMAEAVVGDDVFGDDPTVKELERRAAALVGHQAALFVPSGTMGNLIAIRCHARPGEEAFAESLSHSFNSEGGGAAWIAGVQLRTLEGKNGLLDPQAIAHWARPGNEHSPRTALVLVENTHNFAGGRVVPVDHFARIAQVCRDRGIKLHLDGARLFNAAVATKQPAEAWGLFADSVMFCVSKGLGAPIGSLLCGPEEFVKRARIVRKALGGGMRQAGVIAAAGLVALEEGPKHLEQDHKNAKALALAMSRMPGTLIDPATVETNIVFMRTGAGPSSYPRIQKKLEADGVLAVAVGDLGLRFVTHRDVNEEDVERAISSLGRVMKEEVQK
ncbi:MAG TPA: GntG family PLP-dependent aldolase [Planctomycetota bacterium]|nr:GntG family PLP-dependent aldolase [Planctomycetota bacterium]